MADTTVWDNDAVRIVSLSLAMPSDWLLRVDADHQRALAMEPVEEPILIIVTAEAIPTTETGAVGAGADEVEPDVGRYLATLMELMTDPVLLDVAEAELAGLPGGRILATHRTGPRTVALDLMLVASDGHEVSVQVTGPLERRPEISAVLDELIQRSASTVGA